MIPAFKRIVIYDKPVDMRAGMNTLYSITQQYQEQQLHDILFIFIAKHRKLCKLFWVDASGYSLYLKRLNNLRFNAPWLCENNTMTLTQYEVALFLQGSQFTGHYALTPNHSI
jgi:transposase